MRSDFLVVGSGIAGFSFALKAAQLGKVIIITKQDALDSNTAYAQGGIACVTALNDDPEAHYLDTMNAGAWINNVEAVRKLVKEGPACIQELIDLGIHFSEDKEGKLALGREGGHTRNRIIHTKDFTGKEIAEALYKAIRHHPNILVLENYAAVELVCKTKSCKGVLTLDIASGLVKKIQANYTMICTGGAGHVYSVTTNPLVATGDGVAMAWRAGAEIKDMEFVQFHPTALRMPGRRSYLISEALRGAGAELVDEKGKPFMYKYHPMGSLAPRDIVARAMVTEMKASQSDHVFLDATGIGAEKLKAEFPSIYSACLEAGINITIQPIPVAPSAHYFCGGIATDLDARTNIRNLYAIGEAACTGVHGANRLASNSLLEGMVFAAAAFKAIRQDFKPSDITGEDNFFEYDRHYALPNGDAFFNFIHERVGKIMSFYAGITRDAEGLTYAAERLNGISEEVDEVYQEHALTLTALECRNIVTVAVLTIQAALERKESCGLHYLEEEVRV